MFSEKALLKRAAALNKTIVFPEAGFSETIVEAAKIVHRKKIAKVVLIGDESALVLRYKNLKGITIINPKTSDLTKELSEMLYGLRKEKGLTKEEAEKLILDPIYYGVMLVKAGYADGMVAGAETSSRDVIRPALQIIKSHEEGKIVSSLFIMTNSKLREKAIVLADCALNVLPSADELLSIADETVRSARYLAELEPRVAFLSYSTKGSAKEDDVLRIRQAAERFSALNSEIESDGEMQLDAAVSQRVREKKAPSSSLTKDANVLIFPDVTSGNIAYKTMQYFGGMKAIGPIIQGLKMPVNDLSRGCTSDDVVLVTAITALQCEQNKKQ